MKNTTLARKPKNDMHSGAGMYKPRKTASQAGDGADFAFNGQMGDGVNRAANRFAGNQSGLSMKENFGRGPTKGNQDYDAHQGKHREPPTSGLPSTTKTKNPDYINGGAQYRGVGGTTSTGFSNADKINVGRGPTKGNQQ